MKHTPYIARRPVIRPNYACMVAQLCHNHTGRETVLSLMYFYRPKRSFGQGNIFRSVCHSVHGGGCLLLIWGVPAPYFRGGVPALNFRGGCLLQILGGACSKFSGGGACSKFWGVSNFRNTVNVRPVRILLECILVG